MPLDDITLIEEGDTFQTLFNKNNDIITRLNILDIGGITTSNGIHTTTPDSVGNVTLSAIIEKTEFKVSSSTVPAVGTIGYFSGNTFETDGITNGNVFLKETPLAFITEHVQDGFKVTTSGKVNSTSYAANTVYYLGNTSGILDTAPPSTAGKLVKPVIFGMGITYGGILLSQPGTIIQDSNSYSKSSSRSIAEIPSALLSIGHVIFYDSENLGWTQSNANNFKTAEVFGIVESIAGLTAYAVTRGSVKVPSNVLNRMGSPEGGEGGEDIWFLSGTTAGHMQNLAPTIEDHISKPLYYNAPHSFSGITYSGIFVNYLGYKIVTDNLQLNSSQSLPESDTHLFTNIGNLTPSINTAGPIENGYASASHISLLGQMIINKNQSTPASLEGDVVVGVPANNYNTIKGIVGYSHGFTSLVTSSTPTSTGDIINLGWGTTAVSGKVITGGTSISLVRFYKNSNILPSTSGIKVNIGSNNFTISIGPALAFKLPTQKDPYSNMRIIASSAIPSNIISESVKSLVNQLESLTLNVDKLFTETKINKVSE